MSGLTTFFNPSALLRNLRKAIYRSSISKVRCPTLTAKLSEEYLPCRVQHLRQGQSNVEKLETDVLVIKNRRIPVKLRDLPQHELKYYLENPRLYTLVRGEGKEPTQEEIEETLIRMDHVKELAQSIKGQRRVSGRNIRP